MKFLAQRGIATRSGSRRKIGIVDHAYDLVRYMVSNWPATPTADSRVAGGTFSKAQRLAKRFQRLFTDLSTAI